VYGKEIHGYHSLGNGAFIYIGPGQLQNCCCQTAEKCRMRILYKIQSKQLFVEREKREQEYKFHARGARLKVKH
jgi:hypothetical protein